MASKLFPTCIDYLLQEHRILINWQNINLDDNECWDISTTTCNNSDIRLIVYGFGMMEKCVWYKLDNAQLLDII